MVESTVTDTVLDGGTVAPTVTVKVASVPLAEKTGEAGVGALTAVVVAYTTPSGNVPLNCRLPSVLAPGIS